MKRILAVFCALLFMTKECFAKETSFVILYPIQETIFTLVIHVTSRLDLDEEETRNAFLSQLAEEKITGGCNRAYLPTGLHGRLLKKMSVPGKVTFMCSPVGMIS